MTEAVTAPAALTERRGNVLIITLNRPEARNAVNSAVSTAVGDALQEAQDTPATISSNDLRRRRDFRDLPIVTIDGETARDFDDAVLVRKLDNGNQEFLFQSIAGRPFERHFSLADHVEVEGASYENGLLQIELARKIPEAMKPRRVAIGAGASTSKTEKLKTVDQVRAAS